MNIKVTSSFAIFGCDPRENFFSRALPWLNITGWSISCYIRRDSGSWPNTRCDETPCRFRSLVRWTPWQLSVSGRRPNLWREIQREIRFANQRGRNVPCPWAFCLQNFNISKHDVLRRFWVLCLIVQTIMLYNYMTEFFFDGIIWTPWKWVKTLDAGSRASSSGQDHGHFPQNFRVKSRIDLELKGDINAISYNWNNWRNFLSGQDMDSKKKWLESWHMSESGSDWRLFG